jgi:hypothetical protein
MSTRQRSIGLGAALVLAGAVMALALLGASPPQPPAQAAIIDAAKYPNLQAAFDAVPEGGGLVKLPPGNFELAEPLVLSRAETRVVGSGAATHLINRNAEGKPALIVRPKDLEKNRRAWLWRVQLANFRISGNPKSGDGLLAQHINEIFLHGLSIDHNGGNGITLVSCLEDARVADSILTYNKLAGLNILGGHDVVVSANQFEENQDALRYINGFNLCMTGNNIDDHLRHGVVIENTYGSVVSGNMIEECRGTAIVLDRDCYGIALSANVIAHNTGGGVDLRDAWGCAVSANTFVLSIAHGVQVGPNSGRIALTGNTFCNSHIGGKLRRAKAGQDAARGIVLDATSDITITGNTFSGLAESAVKATGECKRLVLSANVMADLSRSAPGKHPPLELGTVQVIAGTNAIEGRDR